MDSIVLPDGLLTSLVQDVKDFLQSEHWYIRAGIPYRRGYLLYGPPGTGKSTFHINEMPFKSQSFFSFDNICSGK